MLSKLLKYEMKSTARIFLPLFAVILFISGINRISMMFFSDSPFFQIPQALLIAVYVFSVIAAFVACLIVTILRFYKNLLGTEGYLMFTLPVSAAEHILSKFLSSLIWMLSTLIIIIFSVFILLPDYSWLGQISEIWALLKQQAESQLGFNLTLFVILVLLLALVSLISFIMQVYVSISIGQLSNNHKLLISFGVFLCLYLIHQVLMTVGIIVVGYGMYDTLQSAITNSSLPPMGNILVPLFILQISLDAAISIAAFLTARHLLDKKLNLE